LGAGLRGLGLFKSETVGFGLDDEKRCTLLDKGAVLIPDLLQVTLDAGDKVGRIHGGHVSCRLEITRDLLLNRIRDGHLGRWRRYVRIALPTAGERGRRQNDDETVGARPGVQVGHNRPAS